MPRKANSVTEKNGQVQEPKTSRRNDNKPSGVVSRIAAELVDEQITPGAGGIITSIPSESIYEEADLGDELDLAKNARIKLRKPGRREWLRLLLESEYQTRLLVHSPKKDDIEKHQ